MDKKCYIEMAKTQDIHWWYAGRRHILSAVISKLPLNKDAKILEVGCGTGSNLDMLKQHGTVYGAEPYAFAREFSSKNSGCVIEDAFLPDNIPFDHNFDVIGAFDVIEHIEQDQESLQAIEDRLNDNGYALFTVPAFQWLWSKHDEINHHKKRYTKSEFKLQLKQAGYDIEFFSYYNFWLFPLDASIRTIRKMFKLNNDSTDAQMPKSSIVNKTLTFIFSSERFLLSSQIPVPCGLSILAVCKKKA
jgi:SAM-dependent methyltransferase